jgi:hypothetical protein
MEKQTILPDSQILLTFGGYSLAYGFHLYTHHSVKPDTLCQLVLLQQGEMRYVGFESETAGVSFCTAREYLNELEDSESFDAAAIVVDIHSRLNGYQGVDDLIMLSMFSPDVSAGRYIRCPYDRIRGEVMPLSAPILIGAWSDLEMNMGEQWVLQGMQTFHKDHRTVM